MKTLKVIGAILAIFLIGYLIDWIGSREERAILAPIQAAVAAMGKKDWPAIEHELDPEFSYASPVSWVGEGQLAESRAKLESFWPNARLFEVILRDSKTEKLNDSSAKAELSGNIKAVVQNAASGFMIYKFRAAIQLRRAGGGWKVLRIDLPQLEPGLF